MNTLRKKILKGFSSYKLWLIILIFVIIQSTFGQDMDKKIKAKQPDFVYNDSKEFIDTLENCIKWIEKDKNIFQNIPSEITVAQAVIESDYGTSRFSNEANNLFGIRTYDLSLPHIKPLNDPTSKFGLKKYKTKCNSVEDYIKLLNNGFAFEEFRELRFKMIKNNDLDVLILVKTLSKYASNPNYIKLIQKTIRSLRNERISTTN
jgi:uncharacterized FlgJ-related protein